MNDASKIARDCKIASANKIFAHECVGAVDVNSKSVALVFKQTLF